ncbi:hypothetical protein ACTFIW_003369 [Dictyostelium discoideum]
MYATVNNNDSSSSTYTYFCLYYIGIKQSVVIKDHSRMVYNLSYSFKLSLLMASQLKRILLFIYFPQNLQLGEIYGSEVLLPIKIKDTPKMFDETETERVRKLAKSIKKNNEAKQSLLKLNYHSNSNTKKSVNSMGHQVMLHQVAIIKCIPTTVFRGTRSKLTSMWTSVLPDENRNM